MNARMICRILKHCLWVLVVTFLLASASSCSKDVSSDDRFTGSWRMKKGKSHKILIFKANGTWQSQVRKEGRLGKVVTKEEEVLGTWVANDNVLQMIATETKLGDAWIVGEPVLYDVMEITELSLKFKKPNGTVEKWVRVKGQKAEEKERLARAVSDKPIIVNLRKVKPGEKDHYLCIELEFVFKPLKEGESLPPLHPKVRESAIFHLSSLSYAEVNTMPKVSKIKDKLLTILNPYARGKIESIGIQNITVTSRWKSVESFLNQYQESATEADENGKKETDQKI